MHPSAPAAPAQIHVPNLAPPLPFRVRSAVIVARRRFGMTLLLGGAALAATTFAEMNANAPHALYVLAATWMAGIVIAAITTARAGAWRTHEAPSAKVSWGFFFAGLALVSPLTLHALLQTWEWAPSPYFSIGVRSFGGWATSTLHFTGLAHIFFTLLCFIRGYRGDRKPPLALISVLTTVATLPCCLLWGVYGLLPTAYVAVTTVPLLYGLRRLERMHDAQ